MNQLKDIQELKKQAGLSSDFITTTITLANQKLFLSYYKTLIDEKWLQDHFIHALQNRNTEIELKNVEDIRAWIPIQDAQITSEIKDIQFKLMKGHAIIQINENDRECMLLNLASQIGVRNDNTTENEFSVVGPKIGFVENIDTNIHLLRCQLNIPSLIVKEMTIGTVSKTKVVIIYIDGVTNEENIRNVEQRLSDIDFDVLFDSSILDQLISDNSFTPFPLFVSTERRDRVAYALISGQVAIISDGSPYFVTGPSTLFDFFISPEDYYLPWILGSFFRLIRIFGVIFSVYATSIYVALTTFHYEMIPKDLLGPLIFSRNNVPFPPVLEVLFLEITIEFLREAGARLPTKIGQTLGIVGGIVIGQAAVEAALTSNILIITVALSALASFATPIYKMSNTIRFLRFPMIVMAAFWGNLGIIFGTCFILIHITRLKSLGHPYTVPFYPLRIKDLKDSFIRSSYELTNTRQGYLRPISLIRYSPKKNKKTSGFEEEE
ncbi:spore germination protein [Paenibacillus prosopidis]|uniref:GerA spore germination protein n=1 Tax=Paenibacillus prosopidis TaxID=630520 RepID=A0A368W3Q1_9BACL|nr:spore germination protein [Paenibacillus prosopidis]RCW49463.1 GerA spore germination protein [Paenibacillus prosopidis]